MKNYEKPIALVNSGLAEGVFMASGANGGTDCYTVTTNIHQRPETGREDYRIQVNAVHAATDGHHSGHQVLTLSFNQPVKYVSSNGSIKSGDGTTSIKIEYAYHNNGGDNIGLGDVVVESGPGLSVTGSSLWCNHNCGQH